VIASSGRSGTTDVGQHEAPGRTEIRVNQPEELGLAPALQVVDDERGDDAVEGARRKRVLDPPEAEVDPIGVEQRRGPDALEIGYWIHRRLLGEHPHGR
jgi:hypothetical protein